MLKARASARRRAYIILMHALMGAAAVLTCALVLFMIGYILGNGIPNITWEMLSTAPSYLANRVGILPDILSTLYIVIGIISKPGSLVIVVITLDSGTIMIIFAIKLIHLSHGIKQPVSQFPTIQRSARHLLIHSI